MTKKQYWKTLNASERLALAEALNTSSEYLRLVFMHDKKTSAARARAISEYSKGVVGAHEFCPSAFSADDNLSTNNGSRLSA